MVPQRTAFCWAHVDDVADGHVRAMEHGKVNENYHICGPPHTLIDALAVAEQLSGVRAPRLTAPPALLKTMSALMRAIEWLVPVPSNYSSEYLRVSAGVTYLGTNAKARAALAWVPRDLAVGLAETLPHEMAGLAGPLAGQPLDAF
jgi:nucleoside-diphosphate-sugar epimerase